MTTLKEKCELHLKANWMKANDYVTEARLTAARKGGGAEELGSLQQGVDRRRIRVVWPVSYPWPLSHKWLFPLLSEFRRNFAVEYRAMPFYENAICFQVKIDGRAYPFAIDAYDKVEINEECASQVVCYFKMQYANEGYPLSNVVPGGFIPAHSNLYLHLDKARAQRDRREFLYDAYGRFGGRFAKTIRGRAVEVLSSQQKFGYEGGIGRVSYKESLFEVARSKVCVDLPGYGPFCFRLIDYMAVGACIIAYPHNAQLYVPLTPGREIVYCKEDFSDLNELCEYYINHEQEREAIARASREYFDAYLSRPKLAAYYVQMMLKWARVSWQ